MEILEEDFSEEFLSRFGNKEKQYILDFCNTFQRTFPDVLDKEKLMRKISELYSLEFTDNLNDGEYGKTDNLNGEIRIRPIDDKDELRGTIYHELFHLISNFADGFWGLRNKIDATKCPETAYFDEIMNEFYTIKMLENEGRTVESQIELEPFTKSNKGRIVAPKKSNGYYDIEPLAEIYHKTFGEELLLAKLNGTINFKDKFNDEFKNLDIKTQKGNELSKFSKIGIQIGEDKYKAGETALRIWKQKYIEKHSEDKFDLYEYLKESFDIQKSLYRLETFSNGYRGNINVETLSRYSDIFREFDEELIIKHYRPDLVGEQTETDKIIEKKQIRAVIDSLRDNIEGLTKEEIGEVSYGTIPEYTHSNMHCLIIKAGKKEFMTFADEDEYRGSSEFSKLPESITQEIFGDNRNVEYAEVPTHRYK